MRLLALALVAVAAASPALAGRATHFSARQVSAAFASAGLRLLATPASDGIVVMLPTAPAARMHGLTVIIYPTETAALHAAQKDLTAIRTQPADHDVVARRGNIVVLFIRDSAFARQISRALDYLG